jgi:hypothetical protein
MTRKAGAGDTELGFSGNAGTGATWAVDSGRGCKFFQANARLFALISPLSEMK